MNRPAGRPRPLLAVLAMLPGAFRLCADDRVILVATASDAYRERRVDASGQPRVQSYVVMEGSVREGGTRDRSAETMPFQQIAGLLAPELAKQHYLPARDIASADLLLIVHRGTTLPQISSREMRAITLADPSGGEDAKIEAFKYLAQTSAAGPGAAAYVGAANETLQRMRLDQLTQDTDNLNAANRNANSRMLGYGQQLNRMERTLVSSAEEDALRLDVASERYFIFIRAYDLKARPAADGHREPVWVLYANMSVAGQDFTTAVTQMSFAAKEYFGRSTAGLQTVRPAKGDVRLAPLEIKDETPAHATPPPAPAKRE